MFVMRRKYKKGYLRKCVRTNRGMVGQRGEFAPTLPKDKKAQPHRWNRNPRPQPQKFSKLVCLI